MNLVILKNILKNVDNIAKVKVQEKVKKDRDQAVFSKELALLEYNVPIDFDLDMLEMEDPNRQKLKELFTDLEFRRFAQEYGEDLVVEQDVDIRYVDSAKIAEEVITKFNATDQCAVLCDIEETKESVECLGFYVTQNPGEVFYVSFDQVTLLKPLFENQKSLKIVYDAKETKKWLIKSDIELCGKAFDVMLAGYLLKPAQSTYKVEDLAWEYLKRSLAQENTNADAVGVLYELSSLLIKELEEKSLNELFENIEMPLSDVLFKIECEGVKLDVDFLNGLSKECAVKIQKLTEQLYAIAEEEFNINSPKQLSSIIFDKLGLPVIKKTKTGFSTDESVLTTLAQQHEFPALVLEYRHLAKLKSTYIDALPKLVNTKTDRIHAQFLQAGTETGRLSSRKPNLQNIPIRTELGRQVRKAIVPSKNGYEILAADYSQIELRVLAHLSQDKNLIKAFQTGQDIHTYTSSLIFDVDEKDVTSEMRYSAKRINFGIVYGMSSFGLSKDLGISPKEAQEFIDKYFERYPGIKIFMDEQIALCKKQGYVLTLLNRRRYIPEINSKNIGIRQFAQRQAINTPVQGSAADLIKLAMINVQQELEKKELESRLIMTVHDELVLDVPNKEKKEVAVLVQDVMEHSIELSVPIAVSVKAGQNWLEMKEVLS